MQATDKDRKDFVTLVRQEDPRPRDCNRHFQTPPLIPGAVMFGMAFALSCVISAAPASEMGKPELIGIAVKSVVFGNSHAVLARSPEGQPDMFYVPFYSTTGSALIGYHSGTGEVAGVKLGSSGGYGCCVGTDGALYIGGVNPGDMYRYDPRTGELESLGGSETGASYIWATAASEDGKIYGACYPTCKVIEYDIATRKMKDLGKVNDREQYSRSICVDHRSRVWVGVGTHAHLVVLDPGTGARHDVLPDEYQKASSCYDLAVSGKYVVASVEGGVSALLVFDAETEELMHSFPPPDSVHWMNSHGAPEGYAYAYACPDGDLYEVDITEGKLTLLAEKLGQCERVVDGRYVHGINDQDYFLYDLKEKQYLDRQHLTEAGDGMAIQTLTGARDGNIYGSTYINQHMFRYDPAEEELTDLGKVIRVGGQVDSICTGHDGKVYMGAYVLAHLAVYDPSKLWKPGRDRESNPRELGAIGHGQYRTCAITLGPHGNIWVGSIPSYNSGPTGAFSRWNPESGAHETWTDLVPGGAVHHVAMDERYVYCAGGGVFFVWDPVANKKAHEEKLSASSLITTPNGMVVISGGEEMFVFDPERMKVVGAFPSPIGRMDTMTVAPNKKLYGINPSALCEIEPGTWAGRKICDEGGKFLAADGEGSLYFARGSKLYRLRPAANP